MAISPKEDSNPVSKGFVFLSGPYNGLEGCYEASSWFSNLKSDGQTVTSQRSKTVNLLNLKDLEGISLAFYALWDF